MSDRRYRLTVPVEFTALDDADARHRARELAEMLRWLAEHYPRINTRDVKPARLQRVEEHRQPVLVEAFGGTPSAVVVA